MTLLTVHSAKGLEFPVVFVVQMNEGMFPHERNAELGLEEERRLAYVAFTRAMQRLVVTRTLTDIQGRPTQPSRFLFDLPADVIDGDLPGGTAATGERDQRRVATTTSQSKFGAFLAYRQARAAGMPPPIAPPGAPHAGRHRGHHAARARGPDPRAPLRSRRDPHGPRPTVARHVRDHPAVDPGELPTPDRLRVG